MNNSILKYTKTCAVQYQNVELKRKFINNWNDLTQIIIKTPLTEIEYPTMCFYSIIAKIKNKNIKLVLLNNRS